MKPIFYKNKSNGEAFKVQLKDGIPQDQIDACLDAIGYDETEFITEEEFNASCDDTMDINVKDTTESYIIGVLTTKRLDLEEVTHIN